MKTNRIIYIIIALLISTVSCKKDADFLQSYPHDSMTDETFWKSETDAVNTLTKCYSNSFNREPWLEECSSDNSYEQYDWFSPNKLIADGSVNQFSDVVKNMWTDGYTNIRSCNFILENLNKVPFKTAGLKERIAAEAKFIRAWEYLRLTFHFGNVPLVIKTLTVKESKEVSPASQQEIYRFIITELDNAATALPARYSSSGDAARITQGACYALKARTYLFQNDYTNVLAAVKQVEDLGLYSLHTAGTTPYNDLFSGANNRNAEIILSVNKTEKKGLLTIGHGANGACLIKGLGGDEPYTTTFPTGLIVDAYPMLNGRLIHEAGAAYDAKHPYANRDPRLAQSIIYPGAPIATYDGTKVNWVTIFDPEDANSPLASTAAYSYVYGPVTGLLWKKYCDFSVWGMTNFWDNKNDILLIRYADVLLMKAEALLGTTGTGSKATVISLINQLRDRCKGGRVHEENYNSITELTRLVRNERRVELANEGTRYYDLIRWKTAENNPATQGEGLNGDVYGAFMRLDGIGKDDKTLAVDGAPRRYIESRSFDKNKRYLLPIPQREIDLNPNIKQNNGWK